MKKNTHYSDSLDAERLSKKAKVASKFIMERIKKFDIEKECVGQLKESPDEYAVHPLLYFSGLSGISSATAIALNLNERLLHVGMLYIRKSNEQHHGNSVEANVIDGDAQIYIPFFVDDFMEEGKTFLRCKDRFLSILNSLALSYKFIVPEFHLDNNILMGERGTIMVNIEYKDKKFGYKINCQD